MSTTNAKSDYLEQKFIEAALKNTSFAGGATLYVALFTAVSSGETPSVTEVTGGSYARQAISASGGWSSGGQVSGAYEVSNASAITFPTATADWGDITHFGIYDASTSGHLFYFAQLDTLKTINTGDTFEFATGTLKVNEA